MMTALILQLVVLLVLLLLIAGAIILQVFLSKRESKWPGLILPGICVLCSILAVLGVAVFSTTTFNPEVWETLVEEFTGNMETNGASATTGTSEVIDVYVYRASPDSVWSVIGMIAGMFLLCNIPTAVLLAIYFACREKRKRRKELEKMNAQDLE